MFFPISSGGFNILRLSSFVTAKEQQYDLIAGMCIINTISGAVMNTQLKNLSTYIFMIAYITQVLPVQVEWLFEQKQNGHVNHRAIV